MLSCVRWHVPSIPIHNPQKKFKNWERGTFHHLLILHFHLVFIVLHLLLRNKIKLNKGWHGTFLLCLNCFFCKLEKVFFYTFFCCKPPQKKRKENPNNRLLLILIIPLLLTKTREKKNQKNKIKLLGQHYNKIHKKKLIVYSTTYQ
jgi:hypothetical protein